MNHTEILGAGLLLIALCGCGGAVDTQGAAAPGAQSASAKNSGGASPTTTRTTQPLRATAPESARIAACLHCAP